MRLAPESPLPMLESVRLGDEPHSMTASSALAGTGRPEPNSATYAPWRPTETQVARRVT
jgi:hypothetical protein